MNTTLTVDDPLAGREVTIVISLARPNSGEQPRDERPILLSLGTAGQRPVLQTGVLGNVPALIHQAWTAFGVQAQLAAAQTAAPETEGIGEEQVVATASTDDEEPTPTPLPQPTAPKPQAKNLSLF